MSASPSIDAYDAQMLDFSSDPDVTMHLTGSAEFFAEALMDHDGHLSVSTFGEHASIEVDMEEYVGDNAEYEMTDETAEYSRSHGDELLDIEVYDASHAPSPLVPPQPLQPSIDVPIDSAHPASTLPSVSEHGALSGLQDDSGSGVHPAPFDRPAADVPHVESLATEGVSSEAVPLEPPRTTAASDESTLPVSESHEQVGETGGANEQSFDTPAPADAVDEAEHHALTLPVAEKPNSGIAQYETSEPPSVESAPLASAGESYDNVPLIQDDRAAGQAPVTEGVAVDHLRISDGVYIDPPPAVLLSIADLTQPEFVLFNQPDVEGESSGGPNGDREAYPLLLENRPTLYYESLTSVFEALRQDEALLSRVPHSFEGELVLDAHDLQLAVSEDNVHSREITLHDLNILHDGSNFVGPLRLLLRANVPRFIIRYYALQEQIQRLNVATGVGEGEHDEERHEEYDSEERHLPQQEEATIVSSIHASVVPVGLEVASAAEAEELVKEPAYLAESTEETLHEHPEDAFSTQDLATEYREVTGEVAHALQDEDEYEGTNAGDEIEPSKSESLDADQVHDTAAEDIDAAAAVAGHGSEFGGEQTEYLDYVQPEEYDERYGEDFPERAGGASIQYDEPPQHEEKGEQDTSTTVDETQVIFPGEDEDEEDASVVTPIPARAVLESESSEPTDKVTDTTKQDNAEPSSKESATSESTKDIVQTEQTLGNQGTNFPEVEQSESNLVSLLEREADAEFDRSFNAEQNGQEGSVEATLQQESTWDEWDDEDAEGEDEEDWIDPDAVSNESSVTLSSKSSSKRCYDEVDPTEITYVEDPHASPDSKRPRVQ